MTTLFLEMPTCAFGETLIQKSITYSCHIQIILVLVHWDPLENGDKIHKRINKQF
jgi:hypothetical protein